MTRGAVYRLNAPKAAYLVSEFGTCRAGFWGFLSHWGKPRSGASTSSVGNSRTATAAVHALAGWAGKLSIRGEPLTARRQGVFAVRLLQRLTGPGLRAQLGKWPRRRSKERQRQGSPSNFFGCERCNDFSIGIELEGCDTSPLSDAIRPRRAQYFPYLRFSKTPTRLFARRCVVREKRGAASFSGESVSPLAMQKSRLKKQIKRFDLSLKSFIFNAFVGWKRNNPTRLLGSLAGLVSASHEPPEIRS